MAVSTTGIRIDNLSITAGDRPLLDQASIRIAAGNITVIVGPSGAGKSVLLRTLAGLTDDDDAIEVDGTVAAIGDDDRVDPDATFGIVFQQFALIDQWSARQNVQFAIDHRRRNDLPPEQDAMGWLDELGVPPRDKVATLSGGQKQRLAIARTLAADPALVLYDEPTSGLDSASSQRVAALIRRTHEAHGRTSVIVTHDYITLLPIADDVLLFDAAKRTLTRLSVDQRRNLAERIETAQPTGVAPGESPPRRFAPMQRLDSALVATGRAASALVRLPVDLVPTRMRPKWLARFFVDSLLSVGGWSAIIYLAIAGSIVGFAATYFTFRFLPFRLYTGPLLLDELLTSIGFALYRVLVPIMATVLIAARCGAAIAADVGVKRYGGQIDALRTMNAKPTAYLLLTILAAMLVATPALQWVAFEASRLVSLLTFSLISDETGLGASGGFFWQQHFHREIDGEWFRHGWRWVLAKSLACGAGTAVIGYHCGGEAKRSAREVSDGITKTVLWSTLWVLAVHFVVALFEF